MQKLKFLVSYRGTNYQGWQRQPHTQHTVQQQIELALSRLLDQAIRIQGSGRTDSGTHALGQVFHLQTDKDIHRYQWLRGCNSLLPDDIRVRRVWQAPAEFHALHSASEKTYKYVIARKGWRAAFEHDLALEHSGPLDLSALNAVCQPLIGEHDFKSFQTRGTDLNSTTRRVLRAQWHRGRGNRIIFTISATGFLKQMVRNIVGTQLDLVASATTNDARVAQMQAILQACDRRRAGSTAPAHGLYLFSVKYPRDLDIECLRL